MRFVVKPHKFRKTPLLLKRALGAQKLVSYPGRYQPPLDYRKDFFLAFPRLDRYPNPIVNVPDSYSELSSFYASDKHTQRTVIGSSGLKTPESFASDYFVVRPLHHFGGHDYRVTDDPSDFDPTTEYISPAFPKWREYRVLFVLGTPLILLRKKPGPSVGPFDAWNHANGSYFQTVHNRSESPLAASSFFADAEGFCVLRDTHLVAADVLLNERSEYAVTEVNFSPAVSIPSNLEAIAHYVSSHIESDDL
jgi:hypothetical protein